MSDCTHLDGETSLLVPVKNGKARCTRCEASFRPLRGEAWIHADSVAAMRDVLVKAETCPHCKLKKGHAPDCHVELVLSDSAGVERHEAKIRTDALSGARDVIAAMDARPDEKKRAMGVLDAMLSPRV